MVGSQDFTYRALLTERFLMTAFFLFRYVTGLIAGQASFTRQTFGRAFAPVTHIRLQLPHAAYAAHK